MSEPTIAEMIEAVRCEPEGFAVMTLADIAERLDRQLEDLWEMVRIALGSSNSPAKGPWVVVLCTCMQPRRAVPHEPVCPLYGAIREAPHG